MSAKLVHFLALAHSYCMEKWRYILCTRIIIIIKRMDLWIDSIAYMTACFVNLPGFLQMRSNEWFSYIVIKDTPVFLLKLPSVHSTLHIIIRNATIHAFLSGFNPKFNQYGYCRVRTFGALKNRQFYFLHVPMISNGCIKIRSIYAATLLVVDLSSTVSPRAGDKIYISILYTTNGAW